MDPPSSIFWARLRRPTTRASGAWPTPTRERLIWEERLKKLAKAHAGGGSRRHSGAGTVVLVVFKLGLQAQDTGELCPVQRWWLLQAFDSNRIRQPGKVVHIPRSAGKIQQKDPGLHQAGL